jgi:hypothetical protein
VPALTAVSELVAVLALTAVSELVAMLALTAVSELVAMLALTAVSELVASSMGSTRASAGTVRSHLISGCAASEACCSLMLASRAF